jgi:predicted TIM-barrel fold metal-dependent hydrolase
VIDLSHVRVVDNHVHPWRQSTQQVTAEELAGHFAFSDAALSSVRDEYLPLAELEGLLRLFRNTNLGVSYFLRELAHFLEVEENWPEVIQARNAVAGADYRAWTTRLFDDVKLSTLLVDEGGSRPRITLDELSQTVPARLRRVARSDNFVRDLLPDADSWPTFFRKYQELLEAAIQDGAIAFKSVIAYRTGLDIQPVSEDEARRNFEATRDAPLIEQKPFRDFLLCHTMDVARERRLWIHIHTAVGDPDIVFQRANPAQLYPLLHSQRFRANRVVLVHGGWPWVGEAAAMVAILPNVYLDVSEGTIFGMPNMRQRIYEVLEACPYSKILYGADGSVPEALWIVARRYKAVLGRVLAELVGEGFCSTREAYDVGTAILAANAERLYEL